MGSSAAHACVCVCVCERVCALGVGWCEEGHSSTGHGRVWSRKDQKKKKGKAANLTKRTGYVVLCELFIQDIGTKVYLSTKLPSVFCLELQ